MNPIGAFTSFAREAAANAERCARNAKQHADAAIGDLAQHPPSPPEVPPEARATVDRAVSEVSAEAGPAAGKLAGVLRSITKLTGLDKLVKNLTPEDRTREVSGKETAGSLGADIAKSLPDSASTVPSPRYGEMGNTLGERRWFESSVSHYAATVGHAEVALSSEAAVRARLFESHVGPDSPPSEKVALIGAEQEARVTFGKLDVEQHSIEQLPYELNQGDPSRVDGKLEVDALTVVEELRGHAGASLENLGVEARVEAFGGVRALDVNGTLDLQHLTHRFQPTHDAGKRNDPNDPAVYEASSLDHWKATVAGRTEVGVFGAAEAEAGLLSPKVLAHGEVGAGARAKYGVDVFTPSAPVLGALGLRPEGHDPKLGAVAGVAVTGFAGATAEATARLGHDGWRPAVELGAEAFAGAKVAIEGRVGAVLDDREVANVHGQAEAWAGAGAGAKLNVGFDEDGKVKAEASGGAAVAYGAGYSVGVTVDVIGIAGAAANAAADAIDP